MVAFIWRSLEWGGGGLGDNLGTAREEFLTGDVCARVIFGG
jgi:hypothetical protein